jgi:hypothetical protein
MGQETPADFFLARGFELQFSASDGYVWADLRSRNTPPLVHPKYGRGSDEQSAAASAVERWHAEQGA